MHALEVKDAKKSYKDVQALKGVTLNVKKGEFFGLLGPNGAGKTTLISSIVGLCRLTHGEIRVFGKDVVQDYREARTLVGYSPQDVNLDRFFSIQKILEYQAGFFGANRKEQKEIVERLLEQFGLSHKAHVQYYKLSGGMQKRVLVAKALVSKPKLLILDEPTAGVDVEQRHELWKYLRDLKKDGTTIILTTHYIDEAEALCERIGIIHLGEIRELGTPEDLIAKYCSPQVSVVASQALSPDWFSHLKDFRVHIEGHKIMACGKRPGVMTENILRVLTKKEDVNVEDITIRKGNLEEVFLNVTGNKI